MPSELDAVIARVRAGIESAVRDAYAGGKMEFAPRAYDALCYGATRGSDTDNVVEEFHQLGDLRMSDLRALLTAVEEAREAVAWIDGNVLLDVEACAVATATESHYDAMARDLRERLTRPAARAVPPTREGA